MLTGEELKAIRTNTLGWTQKALARELGVSRPTISAWEKSGDAPVERMVFLSIQALLHLPHTRSWGDTGLDTYGRGSD
jgi:transcriptional regulator with XRE-family HTH domain